VKVHRRSHLLELLAYLSPESLQLGVDVHDPLRDELNFSIQALDQNAVLSDTGFDPLKALGGLLPELLELFGALAETLVEILPKFLVHDFLAKVVGHPITETLRTYSAGPRTIASQPFRYSPCGCVTATG
jgi:hypothetical protein